MPEAQQIRRDDDPLEVTEDGLELPAGYAEHEGSVVVRTPAMTVECSVGGGPLGSPLGIIQPRHFGEPGNNPGLAPDKVSLKKYGEDAEVFAVDV